MNRRLIKPTPSSSSVMTHTDEVLSVAWHPLQANVFASASKDRKIRLWNAESASLLTELSGHESGVISLAWHPDGSVDALKIHIHHLVIIIIQIVLFHTGKHLMSGSYDKTARMWDALAPERTSSPQSITQSMSAPSPLPSQFSHSSSSDDITRMMAIPLPLPPPKPDARQVRIFTGHSHNVRGLSVSPSGKRLATGSFDKTLRLWSVRSGALLHVLRGHDDYVVRVEFSPDGSRLLSASYDRTVRVWSVPSEDLDERVSPVFPILVMYSMVL